jgi:hypothetical protein
MGGINLAEKNFNQAVTDYIQNIEQGIASFLLIVGN